MYKLRPLYMQKFANTENIFCQFIAHANCNFMQGLVSDKSRKSQIEDDALRSVRPQKFSKIGSLIKAICNKCNEYCTHLP